MTAQQKMTITIPVNGRAHVEAEVLTAEQAGCRGKTSAFFNTRTQQYDYSTTKDTAHLLHGKYVSINALGDTAETGRFAYGQRTGVHTMYNAYNRKIASIVLYDKGEIVTQKQFHFDEDSRKLLFVTVDSNLDKPNPAHMMDLVWRKVYDTTETWLMREETSVNYSVRLIKTYYRNGRVHELYRVGNNQSEQFRERHGNFEEYNEDGTAKTIGQYYYGEPAGIWFYFDKNGKRTVKNHIKSGDR